MFKIQNLSLKGKITVIWSIALPQLLYTCACLFTPQWVIDKVNDLMFDFLLSGQKTHVKRDTIIANIADGGMQ